MSEITMESVFKNNYRKNVDEIEEITGKTVDGSYELKSDTESEKTEEKMKELEEKEEKPEEMNSGSTNCGDGALPCEDIGLLKTSSSGRFIEMTEKPMFSPAETATGQKSHVTIGVPFSFRSGCCDSGAQKLHIEHHSQQIQDQVGNGRSFYQHSIAASIACSLCLIIVVPILGIPAAVYTTRIYLSNSKGELQKSRYMNRMSFLFVLAAGAWVCFLALTLALACGILVAQDVPVRSTEIEMQPADEGPRFRGPGNAFLRDQGRNLLDRRFNRSLLCGGRRNECEDNVTSARRNTTAFVVPVSGDGVREGAPKDVEAFLSRAKFKVFQRP